MFETSMARNCNMKNELLLAAVLTTREYRTSAKMSLSRTILDNCDLTMHKEADDAIPEAYWEEASD